MAFRDIDEYLAALPPAQREALQALREVIRSADPAATESISYGVPAFKHNGRPLAYFGAAKTHCALYGLSEEGFADELKQFSTSGKGTIRFQPGKPLPAELVTRLVQARIAALEKKP